MTTTYFLVRHAVHGLLGEKLVGRMTGVALSAAGRKQAQQLVQRLAGERVTAIHASPRERTRETAAPLAEHIGIPVHVAPELDEVDLGEWTGRSFEELKTDMRWEQWNKARLIARPPGGESMLEVQRRVVGHLETTRTAHPDGRIVVVSHSDVIRAALLYFLGMSIDEFARIEVSPASVSTVVIGDWGAQVVLLNETASP